MSPNLFKEFEGKRVLICGASGMTGHNLFDFMQQFGAWVTGTYHTRNDFTEGDNIPLFNRVDFTNEIETKIFFDGGLPFDYVFICCAKTYNASTCKNDPQSMILPNISMVSNILSNCLRTQAGKVIYISSATVYQPSFNYLSEDDLDWNQNPHDLYMGIGWVKRYLEKLCEFYAGQGLETLVARPTNIYGRYDKTDTDKCHVVPALIMRALNGENPYTIFGSGKPQKNFIHCDDLTRDLAKVAAFGKGFDVFNLCSDEEVSINDIARMIFSRLQHFPKVEYVRTNVPEIAFRGLNRNKFDSMFGREPYKDIRDGIKDVIEWYSLSHQIVRR